MSAGGGQHDRVNVVLQAKITHRHAYTHKQISIKNTSYQKWRTKEDTYFPWLARVDPRNFLLRDEPPLLPEKQPHIILPCERAKASSPPKTRSSSSHIIPWCTASICPSQLSTWNKTWITSWPSGPRCASLKHSKIKYLCLNIQVAGSSRVWTRLNAHSVTYLQNSGTMAHPFLPTLLMIVFPFQRTQSEPIHGYEI